MMYFHDRRKNYFVIFLILLFIEYPGQIFGKAVVDSLELSYYFFLHLFNLLLTNGPPFLLILLFFPLYYSLLFAFRVLYSRLHAIVCSGFLFFYICTLCYKFQPLFSGVQMLFTFKLPFLKEFGIDFILGVDAISMSLVTLTGLVFFVSVVAVSPFENYGSSFYSALFFLQFGVLAVFCSFDLFFFFVFFEAILLPMFFIIRGWGSLSYKRLASYVFVLYTLFSSVFFIFFIVLVINCYGTTSILSIRSIFSSLDFLPISHFVWLGLFITFATKAALIPVHVWLPWAHGEAPTAGSMVLAGILLKLGVYGIIRILLQLFFVPPVFFSQFIVTFCLFSMLISSVMSFFQTDLKRCIAYTSITHMSFSIASLFTFDLQGISGSILALLAHGIVSPALFFAVGSLYERYGTKEIVSYTGLASPMPLFSFFFFIFMLANAAFPGTASFVGEILGLVGLSKFNFFLSILAVFFLVLNTCFIFWLFTRVIFGSFPNLIGFADVSFREFSVFFILFLSLIWLGLFSVPLLKWLEIALFYFFRLFLSFFKKFYYP